MSDPDWEKHRAVILGCGGQVLTDAEAAFFAETQPLGFILFKRNCESPEQVTNLCAGLRAINGLENSPILIDQEGGRVARLQGPHWRHPPPASMFGQIAERDPVAAGRAAYLNARLMGRDLAGLGIDVNCAPVLDIPQAGAHEIIGDRAYSADPALVASLARAVCDGLMDEGVTPVIKHIPGHGRAGADSHKELPVVADALDVLSRTDFPPFSRLAGAPWAMTAHILYSAIDPDNPATQSAKLIEEIIRGQIGFDGVLISDDIGMEALEGAFSERAGRALAAGCDLVLHCSGDMTEMASFVKDVGFIAGHSAARLARAAGLVSNCASRAQTVPAQSMLDELSGLLPGDERI